MFLATTAWTWAASLVTALLTALGARPAAALLTTPHVDLFTNDYTPTPGDTTVTYTKPTFTGYASAVPTLSTPVNTGTTTQSVIGTVLFTATAALGTGVTCYGCFLSDGATGFYGAYRFPESIGFVNSGDFLSLTIALPIAEMLENSD